MDTFKSFDTDMKVGTRQRREKDEFKIYKMKQQLAGLESNLHAEVKYRQVRFGRLASHSRDGQSQV